MNELYLTDITNLNMDAFEDNDDHIIAKTGDYFFKVIKDTNEVIYNGYNKIVKTWKDEGVLVPLLINI